MVELTVSQTGARPLNGRGQLASAGKLSTGNPTVANEEWYRNATQEVRGSVGLPLVEAPPRGGSESVLPVIGASELEEGIVIPSSRGVVSRVCNSLCSEECYTAISRVADT